ncbi:hypothetical protein E0H86_05005 [Acinetobacter sp. ANC 4635]|uniref:competence protein CoiA family protein n=1 Tax=Acinetobacter sp. ANC 4635 TaxID=2529846 RepID=UPI00103A411F|nr:hypothetical protein [Acinetobacter sp. ANC 4635]TCB32807.1 hypothetical protein E0H86_05005 [Acinetobacter sp. ANC 4635]
MAKYQFAVDEFGVIVNAKDLIGKKLSSKYKCLGCDNELIAKVNGTIIQPHFAHKVIQECSGETYLHHLGKQAFFDTYTKCLQENEPFYIAFHIPKKCHKFKRTIRKNCDLGFIEKKFDLTEYFSKIEVEKKEDSFIPDLLLSRSNNLEDNIYIEIAVTHFLSVKKESSGKRIIEIPLGSEEDVEKIYKADLQQSDALFLGFNQGISPIVDAECKCLRRQFFGFYVWDSGKSFLELTYLSDIESKLIKYKNKIIYSNIIETDLAFENSTVYFGYAHGEMFFDQVKLAAKKNVPIKNCFLCKYRGDNWDYADNKPIFCKAKKFKCGSNQAAECDWYRSEKKY